MVTTQILGERAAMLEEKAAGLTGEAAPHDAEQEMHTDNDASAEAEELDWELIAEIRAADEEYTRLKKAGIETSISLEELVARYKADDAPGGPGALEAARARLAGGTETFGLPGFPLPRRADS